MAPIKNLFAKAVGDLSRASKGDVDPSIDVTFVLHDPKLAVKAYESWQKLVVKPQIGASMHAVTLYTQFISEGLSPVLATALVWGLGLKEVLMP